LTQIVELSVADIRYQIAAEWLDIAQWSQYETTIALSNGTIDDPYELPFPQNVGPKCTRRAVSNAEWPYLRNG